MRDNGDQPRQITIRSATAGEFAQIDVVDTGPGFRITDPEAVFEPFEHNGESRVAS